MSVTTFSVRMDSDIKRRLDDFCDTAGLNTTTAINMFARAVLRENRLPFEVTVCPEDLKLNRKDVLMRSKRDFKIKRLTFGNDLWSRVAEYAESCSWGAGANLAERMRENAYNDWESVFAAFDEDGEISGFCTLEKKDVFPEMPYTPFIGFVFVGEPYRGNRLSEKLCRKAIAYAEEVGFDRVYVGSGEIGLYEKYGFVRIDEKMAPWGKMQGIFEYLIA